MRSPPEGACTKAALPDRFVRSFSSDRSPECYLKQHRQEGRSLHLANGRPNVAEGSADACGVAPQKGGTEG